MKLIKNAPVLVASTANMNVTLDSIYPVGVYENKEVEAPKHIVEYLEASLLTASDKAEKFIRSLKPRDRNFVNMYLPTTKTGVNKVLLYMKMRRNRRAEKQKAYQLRQASVAVA